MREKRATQLLMRVARGFIARNRTRRKRLFIRAVITAHYHTSLDCITPDNLDDLADLIESYQRDYTVAVPIQVMTVLRGLLYMQIGENEEEIEMGAENLDPWHTENASLLRFRIHAEIPNTRITTSLQANRVVELSQN